MGVARKAKLNKPDELSVYDVKDGPFWTMDSDGEKAPVYAKEGEASEKETGLFTLHEALDKVAKRKGDKIAMRTENLNELAEGEVPPPALPLSQWKSWTWKDVVKDTKLIARGLIKLGMKQHDCVPILGFNSPQWALAFYGAIYAGGKASGIYPSDTADQVQYKAFHSNGSVAFVENEEAKQKFLSRKDDLPYLKAIVCWACEAGENATRADGSVIETISYDDLLTLGKSTDSKLLKDRVKLVKPTHCAVLIYTSGTTGRPKAVMCSHDNLNFCSRSTSGRHAINLGSKPVEERVISYLPLSHIAGMLVDILAPLAVSAFREGWASTSFARAYDLKRGTLVDRLKAVEPTVFLGVPRVWEKISEKLKLLGAQTKGIKKKLSTIAKKKGLAAEQNNQLGGTGAKPFMHGFFSKVVLAKIKEALGLGKCHFAFAGAAPMNPDTLRYFGSLGININDAYGMSESLGATTLSTDERHQWGTAGFEIPGAEVRCFIVAEDGSKKEAKKSKDIFMPKEEEQGELCYRGRHIMMGYMANPLLGDDHVEEIRKKNLEAIDEEGWLHSGDKGTISVNGMVRITGRYKELIIGSGGENIAPVAIEDYFKSICPAVSNIMMVGDHKKFNIALLTLKCEGATGELPGSDKLEGAAAAYGKTIKDAVANQDLIDEITKALKATGKNGEVTPSNAAKIQKFTILPKDFSVVGEELTATLKLKRTVVESIYAKVIDAVYASDDVFVPITAAGMSY